MKFRRFSLLTSTYSLSTKGQKVKLYRPKQFKALNKRFQSEISISNGIYLAFSHKSKSKKNPGIICSSQISYIKLVVFFFLNLLTQQLYIEGSTIKPNIRRNFEKGKIPTWSLLCSKTNIMLRYFGQVSGTKQNSNKKYSGISI